MPKNENKKVDEEIETKDEYEEITPEELENVEKKVEVEAEKDEEDKESQKKLTKEEKKIQELEEKVKELEDTILRNEAQYQNIKKRMEREKAQAIIYANETFAHDMLNVIDALESGAKSFEVETEDRDKLIEKVKEGFDLTLEQFKRVFEKHHILPVEGESFDPNFHNAIMKVDSNEHKEGEIVQTLQKGYKIKDRVLRAAMVSIAK